MTKSRTAYPTDLNDTQWQRIAPYVEKKVSTGRPREYTWREIFNGIFYIVKNGCVWRALPHDLPPWPLVYHYFRQFRLNGLWEELNRIINAAVRVQAGREETASALILDSQSVKSAEGGAELGYDGGKHVRGRKRTILVDTGGLVVVALVTGANMQDVFAGQKALESLEKHPQLCRRLQKIIADGGYRGNLTTWLAEHFGSTFEFVLKKEGQKGFQVLPKRWVVERTFAWLVRQRRLARDYERLPATVEAFIYVAMLRIGLGRLAGA